ncbi:hypothetical protein D910_12604, partial [Dendroctonus ponderosae]
MSWVSFWIQADAAPPRTVLGTSTMLSFITLNGNLMKNLPKVPYVKASEIWFFGGAAFIFCSLAEFAFVNVIWRRNLDSKQADTYLAEHGSTNSLNVPSINTPANGDNNGSGSANPTPNPAQQTWAEMTPQEVAIWIDRKARIVFPTMFVIYNLFYWSY